MRSPLVPACMSFAECDTPAGLRSVPRYKILGGYLLNMFLSSFGSARSVGIKFPGAQWGAESLGGSGLPDSGCLPGGPTRGVRGRHSGRRGAYVTSFL